MAGAARPADARRRPAQPWPHPALGRDGGTVRVGLEDNLYLSRGVFASNAELVERAAAIVEAMGARVLTPQDAREKLGLRARQ